MPDCKACGMWFAAVGQRDLCPTCKRALERLNGYAAPVVHGEWLEKSSAVCKRYFECSHCGAHENKHTAVRGYYCWRCGAKMDGGGNDKTD